MNIVTDFVILPVMESYYQLGNVLRMLREVHNFTQEYVANVLDISQTTYSGMEKGESRMTVDRLGKLAELYNMQVSDILTLSERAIINNITNHENGTSHHQHQNVTINAMQEEERKAYLMTIERLTQENDKLCRLIEKLTDKLSA